MFGCRLIFIESHLVRDCASRGVTVSTPMKYGQFSQYSLFCFLDETFVVLPKAQ